MEEEIRRRVEEKLASEEVRLEIERQIEEARKKLFDDAEAQLQREKEAALAEARAKEVSPPSAIPLVHITSCVFFQKPFDFDEPFYH